MIATIDQNIYMSRHIKLCKEVRGLTYQAFIVISDDKYRKNLVAILSILLLESINTIDNFFLFFMSVVIRIRKGG